MRLLCIFSFTQQQQSRVSNPSFTLSQFGVARGKGASDVWLDAFVCEKAAISVLFVLRFLTKFVDMCSCLSCGDTPHISRMCRGARSFNCSASLNHAASHPTLIVRRWLMMMMMTTAATGAGYIVLVANAFRHVFLFWLVWVSTEDCVEYIC